MAERTEDRRINEALELLNTVAKEKSVELQDMVSSKYSELRSALVGLGGRLEEQARETYADGKARVEELAAKVDVSVHKTPWPYLGGAAVGFLILGYFLGRSKK